MNLWICIQIQSHFFLTNLLRDSKVNLHKHTHTHQLSFKKACQNKWNASEVCPYWKTNVLLLSITKGSVNKRDGAVDQGAESTMLYDLTFLHLRPLLPSAPLLALYHTHITSLLVVSFFFLFAYFPSLTQMRSLHWFHSSCLGASGRHSSAKPPAQPCNSQQLQNIQLWHSSKGHQPNSIKSESVLS